MLKDVGMVVPKSKGNNLRALWVQLVGVVVVGRVVGGGSGRKKTAASLLTSWTQLLGVQSSRYHKDQLQFMCADKG